MSNINNLEHSNKHTQGSIWKWVNDAEKKQGVQSSGRPVLIISNSGFNYHSLVVNCVTITGQLRESPVHVPVYHRQYWEAKACLIFVLRETELRFWKVQCQERNSLLLC